jgi:hypothetical protein
MIPQHILMLQLSFTTSFEELFGFLLPYSAIFCIISSTEAIPILYLCEYNVFHYPFLPSYTLLCLSSNVLMLNTANACLYMCASLCTALWSVRVRIRVTLQLIVCQSVRLGVEPTLGLTTRCYFLLEVWCLKFFSFWAPSLTRGRVCHLSV